jgi:prepilin-type N-terminal cleavage/methylation domain-containing protein
MKNTQGFTLVEIMIVVAIIGLLAAIGIPSFQKARANALEKVKENNVRMVETAVEQWAMDAGHTNGTQIAMTTNQIEEYIKGGLHALKVGSGTGTANSVSQAEINAKTVGYTFQLTDLY